ncbi:hypothetical protein N9H59_01830 [Flavobacteriaceae bacterium]|nr:hypothetical protein [Flavobacteriaceae bacterium]
MRSLYELLYIKWSGIDYDREKLNRFILNLKVYRFLSIFSSKFKDQYRKLKVIHGMYDKVKLEKLHNGDEETIRMSIIEKYSRIGSVELLINGVYTNETYTTITNLPIEDFQLVTKRVQELIKIAQSVTTQDDTVSESTPGT